MIETIRQLCEHTDIAPGVIIGGWSGVNVCKNCFKLISFGYSAELRDALQDRLNSAFERQQPFNKEAYREPILLHPMDGASPI